MKMKSFEFVSLPACTLTLTALGIEIDIMFFNICAFVK